MPRALLALLHVIISHPELPWWLSGKESTCQAGDAGSIPGSGRSLEDEMATHSSILAWETLDRGAWWAIVHGVAEESVTT